MTITPPSDTRIISAIRGGSTGKRDSFPSTIGAAPNHRFTSPVNFRPSKSVIKDIPGRPLGQGPDAQRGGGETAKAGGANAAGGTGAQKMATGNSPLDGMLLSQLLNRDNQVKPEQMARMMEDALRKAQGSKDPSLLQGPNPHATAYPEVNKDLDKLAEQLRPEFQELSQMFKDLLENPEAKESFEKNMKEQGGPDTDTIKEAFQTLEDSYDLENPNKFFNKNAREAFETLKGVHEALGSAEAGSLTPKEEAFKESLGEFLNKYEKGYQTAENPLVSAVNREFRNTAREQMNELDDRLDSIPDPELQAKTARFVELSDKALQGVDGFDREGNFNPEVGKMTNNKIYSATDLENLVDDDKFNELVELGKELQGEFSRLDDQELAQELSDNVSNITGHIGAVDQMNQFDQEHVKSFETKLNTLSDDFFVADGKGGFERDANGAAKLQEGKSSEDLTTKIKEHYMAEKNVDANHYPKPEELPPGELASPSNNLDIGEADEGTDEADNSSESNETNESDETGETQENDEPDPSNVADLDIDEDEDEVA